jgi:hypothetical protein
VLDHLQSGNCSEIISWFHGRKQTEFGKAKRVWPRGCSLHHEDSERSSDSWAWPAAGIHWLLLVITGSASALGDLCTQPSLLRTLRLHSRCPIYIGLAMLTRRRERLERLLEIEPETWDVMDVDGAPHIAGEA